MLHFVALVYSACPPADGSERKAFIGLWAPELS